MAPHTFKWKTVVAQYFIFSKWQRNAALFLLVCILLLAIAPAIFLHFYSSKLVKADTVLIQHAAQLKVKANNSQQDKKGEPVDYTALREPAKVGSGEAIFFLFDPNTASFSEWQRLGLRDKTITTIQNYLGKGGHFRTPEDLKKIYGLHPALAEKLIPYVRIKGSDKKKEPYTSNTGNQAGVYNKNKTAQPLQPFEINGADTTAFIALPGIGSKLAARIVNYREKLHGFYLVEQVGETYGLPDSVFQKIKPMLRVNASLIQKMNINTANAEELKTPYIRFNVANAIIQYRLHNGPFGRVEDLRKIPLIDEDLYIKIAPYLKVE